MFSNIELLQKVIDTIEEGVVVSDREGVVIGFNRQATEILQLTEEQIIGSKIIRPVYRPLRTSGEPMPYEELPSTITRTTGKPLKDVIIGYEIAGGDVKWLSVNTRKLVVDSDDYVFSAFFDITEKYALQKQAELSRERLNDALKGSYIGVWDFDPITKELYFSEEWKKIVGYEPEGVNTAFAQWEKAIHPADKAVVLHTINGYLNDTIPEFKIEYRLLHENSPHRWILSTGKIVSRDDQGRPRRFSGTIKDITDRKQIEEQVKANAAKFKNAFNHSAIGIALVSPEGLWMDVNPALCKMLGYTKDEFFSNTFQDITHPDDLEIDLGNVRKVLSKEIETYSMEKRYFHKNGSVVWALLTVSMLWKDEEPQFFISQIVDISETKALITQLKEKNSQLTLATIEQETKVAQLEEFNRIVAHNLRGPLGNILQLGEMLSEDKESSELYISMLKEASTGLDSTLRELIKVLEIKLNKDITFEKCSFEDTIKKIKSMLNGQIQHENVSFKLDLQVRELDYPNIYLESILYNLINNAIKYRRKTVLSEVKISTYLVEKRVALEVADNGLGIDLQRYGHQLFKLNKVFHKGYDSKGLGLFLIKNQIETFGGTIEVKSEPEQGSTFKVIF